MQFEKSNLLTTIKEQETQIKWLQSKCIRSEDQIERLRAEQKLDEARFLKQREELKKSDGQIILQISSITSLNSMVKEKMG